MIFNKKNTDKTLQDLVHPSQLQKLYGGTAENVNHYWPPYYPSGEFGVDKSKLKMKDEYDASVLLDDPVKLPHHFTDVILSKGVTTKVNGVDPSDVNLEERHHTSVRNHSLMKKAEEVDKKKAGSCCVIF